ncbi:hypothetical protein [Dactylosporangium sp. NPDC000521]|uniref:hypothetical protein n=1 Tax=Dactylosporangium sp. NPDC000521 TaxID=3363975 RepID=UPI0036BD8FE6
MAADDLLFVVLDGAAGCLVALDEPSFAGPVSRAGRDGIIHLIPSRAADRPGPPRRRSLRLATGTAAGASAAATVLLTPLAGAALGAAALALGAAGRARVSWEDRRVVLRRPADTAVFAAAFSAAQAILLVWPRLRDLVPVPAPSEPLAASLWTLAGLLDDRAAAGRRLTDLTRAAAGLPTGPASAALHASLADRRARVGETLTGLDAEIDRRVRALEALAGECVDLVRDERAVRAAVDAVRRADGLLDRLLPAHDPAVEFADLTSSIIGAYRELTHLP